MLLSNAIFAPIHFGDMSKWKAFAVFFTLVFFSSLRGTLFVILSDAELMQSNRVIRMILSIAVNLVLLYFAFRFWQKAFSADNKDRTKS